jgi:hypothetical protein
LYLALRLENPDAASNRESPISNQASTITNESRINIHKSPNVFGAWGDGERPPSGEQQPRFAE